MPTSRLRPTTLIAVLILAACAGGTDEDSVESSDSTDVSGTVATDDFDEPTADEATNGQDAGDVDDDSTETAAEPERPPFATIDFGPLPTPIPAADPLSIASAEDGDLEQIEQGDVPLLPVDLLAAVELGVAAGSFSEAEGIARALDGMSGRAVPTPGLGPDDVESPGLTGLSRHAADLLAGADLDDDERLLLDGALVPYAPTQQLLDAISAPAPGPTAGFANTSFVQTAASSAGSAASSAPIEIIQTDCFDVIATGVSTDGDLDTGDVCYYFVEGDASGNRMRVYYPSTWQEDEAQIELADAALDAMIASIEVFDDLATVGDINAVFSLADNGTTLAQQLYFDLDGPCPITMFTTASAGSTPVFKQTVAHEVFHCVQDWSFTSAPYGTHKWWLEGSAEYFSNVVYPAVNDEHTRTAGWDSRSLTRNITQLSYENTVFFQYYANIRGDGATIDLLETVSSAGASLDSIASIDGMEKVWRDFVVAMVADKVTDTGGGTVGAAGALRRVIRIGSEENVELETSPMVAARYAIKYEKGKRFEQTTSESDHVAAAYVADRQDLGKWTEMPTEVRSTCDRTRTYVTVVTTAEEPVTPAVEVNNVEKAVCDPCLLGTWALRLSTFADYILAVASSGPEGSLDGLTLSIDGSYVFDFQVNGDLSAVKNMTVRAEIAGVGSAPATSITGGESGRYDADGEQLKVTGWQGDSTASIGNISQSVFSGPESESTSYTCGDDVLTLTSLPFGELVFDFLEPPPEPPPIIIETGS